MSPLAAFVLLVVVVGLVVLALAISDPLPPHEHDRQERQTLADLERRRRAAGRVR